jgi:hypothetical protein
MADDATGALLWGQIIKFKDGTKEPPAAQLYYPLDDVGLAQAEEFARTHDQQGFSIYSCIGRLRCAPRNKGNVAELDRLVVDLDLRNIVETRDEVIAVLRSLPLTPEIRDSGRGIHAVWWLREPLVDEAGITEAERVMRQLVGLLAADPKPTHRAALLRHLGTHNSRDGGWQECRVLEEGKTCDISEFSDLFDLYGDSRLLHAKGDENATSFDTEGRRLPIDLEAMRYQGQPGMHDTFLGFLGSRLSYGEALSDIIERVVEVAERNCADDPNRSKWRHDLAAKASWWLEKHPEWLETALSAKLAQTWAQGIEDDCRPKIVYRTGSGLEVRIMGRNGQRQSEPHRAEAAAEQTTPKFRFRLVRFCDLRPGMDETPCLIDELIPLAGLVIVWGQAKCLKSFTMLDAMLHVAKGWEWHSRCVQQGAVVYCAFEGAHGYKKRIAALRRHYNLAEDDDVPLFVMPGNANLIADHRTLIKDISSQLNGTKPAAVVLDTLNKSLHGSESKDVDMSNYVRAAEAIRDAFGAVVIIIHHCGLDETRPRGHTSLPGAVDAQLAVTREGDCVRVEVEHMRDGPEGTVVCGRAKVVDVGVDANGQVLTSLVIVPADSPSAGTFQPKQWPRSLKVFREALSEAILSHPEQHQIEGGPRVRATDLERVREAFYKIYVVHSQGDADQKQDTRKKAFGRCIERAQAENLIGVRVSAEHRTLLWLAGVSYGDV